ncbi:hypothetical protein K438DRAFT_1563836, partial [Mycena galopus ATCC 62051]
DNERSEKLVALIMEDADIKRALFAPCGPNASTAKGGGKSKASAQFDLCKLLLEGEAEYQDILARADNSPKDRTALALKIKNRLRTYVAYHNAAYSVLISFIGCRKPLAATSLKWVRPVQVSIMPRR